MSGPEPAGRLLSVETGFGCNNRCAFCYQDDYRAQLDRPPDLPRDDIVARLRYGRAEGFTAVGFSGGEPTIRPDFVDIVALARRLGYAHVAVTTNARRLADPDYCRALVAAGADSFGVSLHAPEAPIHDGLTRARGSFAETLQGLDNLLQLRARERAALRLNLFTLVCRKNAAQVPELLARLATRGVELFVLQPLIYARGTLELGRRLSLDLPELLDTVRRAADVARAHRVRLRLYNLPPCALPDHGDVLDRPSHPPAKIFREHDRARPGDARAERAVPPSPPGRAAETSPDAPPHFFRLTTCAACAARADCPGLHATFLPQAAIAAEVDAALARRPAASAAGGTCLQLAGLELAEADTLGQVCRAARGRGVRQIALYHGGTSILGRAFYAAAVAAGVDSVRFVVHRPDAASHDRRSVLLGNVQAVLAGLGELRRLAGARRVAREALVTLDVGPPADPVPFIRSLAQAGAETIRLQHSGSGRTTGEAFLEAWRLVMRPEVRQLRPRPRFTFVVRQGAGGVPWWQRAIGHGCLTVATERQWLLETPFVTPRYGWVTWSVPHAGLPPEFEGGAALPAALRSPLLVADLGGGLMLGPLGPRWPS